MKVLGTAKISHPPLRVFEALRDETPALAGLMPNIESVEVLEEKREGDITRLVNRWQGSKADVPAILRPFATKQMTSWMDYAAWDASRLLCEWRIEAAVAPRMFICTGSTLVEDDGVGGTLFTLDGELTVDPSHIPGAPRFLGKKLKAPLERFIVGAVTPNLTSIADAVQELLDQG